MADGRIPQSFIDDVLLRTDIVDLIDARVKLKRAGRNYSACCPFHQEKTPSFTVNREKQFYYCFGCGASGNALSFLMEYDRLEFIDGLKLLAGQAGLSLPDTRQSATSAPSQQPLFDTLEAAAAWYEQQLRQAPQRERAVNYLKRRGLTGQLAKQFRIGYAPPGWDNLLQAQGQTPAERERLLQTGLLIHNSQRNSHYDAMRDRIIFPIRDFRGRVIAFGGRVLGDDKPKYLNSPESPVFHKGRELYGLFEARQAGKLEQLLVVEGYMDVVALAQHGITHAVATLGTATSTAHVERMLRLVSDIVFCFDGDAAGRRAAWRALENALPLLDDGISLRFLFLPEGEDPDTLVRREGPDLFRARIQANALPLTDFLFRHLGEPLNVETLEGRSRLASEALPLLRQMPDSLFRTLVIQALAERTALPVDSLLSRLQQLPATATAEATTASPVADRPVAGSDPRAPVPRPAAPARHGAAPPRPQLRSLSAQVIALLLRDPALARQWPQNLLAHLGDAETPLLLQVVDDLLAHPGHSLAALLGRWHGNELGTALADIAATELLPAPEQPALVVADIDRQLRIRRLQHELDQLHAQLRQTPDRALLEAIAGKQQAIHRLQQGQTGH